MQYSILTHFHLKNCPEVKEKKEARQIWAQFGAHAYIDTHTHTYTCSE